MQRTFTLVAASVMLIGTVTVSLADAQVAPDASGVVLYVATDGDDANPGTREEPFATLGRARDAVRAKLAAGVEEDVTVLLRDGTYRLDETVVFGLEDSGRGEQTITYAACPGERAVLSSGVPIRGWRKVEEALAGLPEQARGKVWVADVPQGLGRFRTLYDGPHRLPRARSRGYVPTKRYPRTRPPGWRNTLAFPAGALKTWPRLDDVEIVIVPQYPWSSNILPLASVDEGSGTAQTAVPATYPMGQAHFGVFPDGTISKPTTDHDRAGLTTAENVCRRILVKAGADPGAIFTSPQRGTHPGGTVRIGVMLDTDLRTETPGLYVCDTSVFPEALCRPTVLTLVGLGKRLAKHLATM